MTNATLPQAAGHIGTPDPSQSPLNQAQHSIHTRPLARLAAVALVVVLVGALVACEDKNAPAPGGSGTSPVATAQASSSAGSSAAQKFDYSAAAVARGKELFDSSCTACHGQDGKGIPNLGKDLVHSKFAMGLTDQELVDFIKRGRDSTDPLNTTGVPMPPKGGNPALNDAKLRDIVVYNRSIEKKD